ncbi:hypothetical protein LTR27_011526 [Elasticomyces elasticus]|nr:hypothetical protein LTR27_011526 [Elasticomyces elasticus]
MDRLVALENPTLRHTLAQAMHLLPRVGLCPVKLGGSQPDPTIIEITPTKTAVGVDLRDLAPAFLEPARTFHQLESEQHAPSRDFMSRLRELQDEAQALSRQDLEHELLLLVDILRAWNNERERYTTFESSGSRKGYSNVVPSYAAPSQPHRTPQTPRTTTTPANPRSGTGGSHSRTRAPSSAFWAPPPSSIHTLATFPMRSGTGTGTLRPEDAY